MASKEEQEYKDYLISTGASPQDAEEYLHYQNTYKGGSEDLMQGREKSLGDKLLKGADYAGRGLDYAGGLTRTAVGSALGQYKDGDVGRALEGHAPHTDEYLERAGVGNVSLSDAIPSLYSEKGDEWLKLKKGGMLDPTARGAAGFVGDVALDPLTYLSGGLSAIGKGEQTSNKLLKLLQAEKGGLNTAGKVANTILNPLEIGSKKAGGAIYDSAFEKADRALQSEEGKGSIAELLKKNRFKGDADAALEKAKQIHADMGAKIGDVREAAGKSGVVEDLSTHMSDADHKNIKDIIHQLEVSPEAADKAEAESLKALVSTYTEMGPKDPKALALMKQNNVSAAGAGAIFKANRAPLKAQEDKLRLLLAGNLNKAENAGVEEYLGKGGMPSYLNAKTDYGTSGIFAQKQLAKKAGQEANLTGFAPSAVDWLTAPVLAAHGPAGMLALAAKKGRDVLRMTGPKTHIGLGLEDLSPVIQKYKADSGVRELWKEILKNDNDKEQTK